MLRRHHIVSVCQAQSASVQIQKGAHLKLGSAAGGALHAEGYVAAVWSVQGWAGKLYLQLGAAPRAAEPPLQMTVSCDQVNTTCLDTSYDVCATKSQVSRSTGLLEIASVKDQRPKFCAGSAV